MGVTERDVNEVIEKLNYLKEVMQEKGIEELPTSCNTYRMYQFISFGHKGYLDLDLEEEMNTIERDEI